MAEAQTPCHSLPMPGVSSHIPLQKHVAHVPNSYLPFLFISRLQF